MKMIDYLFRSKGPRDGVTFFGTTVSVACNAAALYCAMRKVHPRLIIPLFSVGVSGVILGIITEISSILRLKTEEGKLLEELNLKPTLTEDAIVRYIKHLAKHYKDFWEMVYSSNIDEMDLVSSREFKQEFSYAFGCGIFKILEKQFSKEKHHPPQILSPSVLMFEDLDKILIRRLKEEMEDYKEDLEFAEDDTEEDPNRSFLYCRIVHVLADLIPKYQCEILNFKNINKRPQKVKLSCAECKEAISSVSNLKAEMQDNISDMNVVVNNFYNVFLNKCDKLTDCARRFVRMNCDTMTQSEAKNYECLREISTFSSDIYDGVGALRTEMEGRLRSAIFAQFDSFYEFRKFIERQEHTNCSLRKVNSGVSGRECCVNVCESEKSLDAKTRDTYCLDSTYRLQKLLNLKIVPSFSRNMKMLNKKVKPINTTVLSPEEISNLMNPKPAEILKEISLLPIDLAVTLKYVSKDLVSSEQDEKTKVCVNPAELPYEYILAFTYGLMKVIEFRLGASVEKVCNLRGKKHFSVNRSSLSSLVLQEADDAMYNDLIKMLNDFAKEFRDRKDLARPLLLCDLLFRMKKYHELYSDAFSKIDKRDLVMEELKFASHVYSGEKTTSEKPETGTEEIIDPANPMPTDPPIDPMAEIIRSSKIRQNLNKAQRQLRKGNVLVDSTAHLQNSNRPADAVLSFPQVRNALGEIKLQINRSNVRFDSNRNLQESPTVESVEEIERQNTMETESIISEGFDVVNNSNM